MAAGLAEYFGLDPTLVRIAWVIAAIFAGAGVLVYIILWIVLPEEETGPPGPLSSLAIDIAEERFAKGEITAEELEQIRRT